MAGTDLNSILIAAEQLASDVDTNGREYLKVDKTLKQVLDSTNKLWSRVASAGPQDTEANLLLSSKGVDLPHLSKKLENISAQKYVFPSESFAVTDLTSYLNNERENAILSIIELTHRKFDKVMEEKIDEELQKEALRRRDNLLNSIYAIPELKEDTPFIQRDPPKEDVLFDAGSTMDQYQILYATALVDYNKSILNGKSVNLTENFSRAVFNNNDKKVNDIWKITSYMSQIPPFNTEDILQSRSSAPVVQQLINQARSYLEDRYKGHIQNVISNSMLQSVRRGEPVIYSLVQSYVKIRLPSDYNSSMENLVVDGLPFWPVCYYCFRCGDLDAVLHCITRSGSDLHELTKAINELKTSPTGRLSHDSAKLFRSSLRSSVDPFKRVIYCILGCCGVNEKHPSIISTSDDYLWIRLCQVQEPTDDKNYRPDFTSDVLSYTLLQSLISEQYGETYFNANEQPHVYFQMLFLTGQFEAAIDVLFRSKKFFTHSVHVAIALHENHLLAVPDLAQKPFLSSIENKDKKPMKRLNICTLIQMYIRLFKHQDANIALHYLFCLRNVYCGIDRCMFPHFVCELVLETEQYEKILGHLEPDGCRIKGFLEQFTGCDLVVNDVIKEVANVLEERGKHFDAVKLYYLCDDIENLLSITNNILSQHLTNLTEDDARINIIEYTRNVLFKKQGQRSSAHPDTISTFNMLNNLYRFFKFYAAQQYHEGLEVLKSIDLIPCKMDDVEAKAERFKDIDPLITCTIADVLFAAMNSLAAVFKDVKAKSTSFRSPGSSDYSINGIRDQARAIVSFAGRIPFQLPGDTNNRLVQLEILIN